MKFKQLSLIVSLLTINFVGLCNLAMESSTMPVTFLNHSALSAKSFNISGYLDIKCFNCCKPIQKDEKVLICECGNEIFKSDNPENVFRTLRHFTHPRCLRFTSMDPFPQNCIRFQMIPFLEYNVKINPFNSSTYAPDPEEKSPAATFKIQTLSDNLGSCYLCHKVFSNKDVRFYFGCGENVYDILMSNTQNLNATKFDAKLKFRKIFNHAICYDCIQQWYGICPNKNCKSEKSKGCMFSIS